MSQPAAPGTGGGPPTRSRAAGVNVLIALAAGTIVIAGMKSASGLIGPVFLALVLTVSVHPLRRLLHRWKLPSWLAALVCIVVVYALLLGLSLSLVVASARFAELLPTYASEYDNVVADIGSSLTKLGIGQEQVQNLLKQVNVSQVAGFFTGLIGSLLSVLSNLAFVLFLVLFLTVDATAFPGLLAREGGRRGPFVEALADFARGTRSYLVVSTVFGFIVAVIDTAALAVMGIPLPLVWGLLAFITNYIPNIGFVIGVVPPAVLGLLEGGPGLMIAVIVVYSLINVVIQSVIQPKFVADAVGLSISLTFLSLVFWAWVLGAVGALMAIPLSLLAKALLVDVDPDSKWVGGLLSNRAPPQDPDHAAADAGGNETPTTPESGPAQQPMTGAVEG